MQTTGISWATHVWNPVTGCTQLSAGCANCYAKRMSMRLRGRCGYPADDPFRPTFHENKIDEPLHVKRPGNIFVCSMGDLFHDKIAFEDIAKVFDTMCNKAAMHHTFLILTKRPHRMAQFIEWLKKQERSWAGVTLGLRGLFPNIWAGATVETLTSVSRCEQLLRFPANLHFLSCEPLLSSVKQIEPFMKGEKRLKWIIAGGETGPSPRPTHPLWVRELQTLCRIHKSHFYFKQWGNLVPEYQWPPSLTAKTADWRAKYFDGVVKYSGQPSPATDEYYFRMKKELSGDFLHGHQCHETPTDLDLYQPRNAQKGL